MENRAERAIRQLAKERGVPEEQIVFEIEVAISEGLKISRQTGNRDALKIWDSVPRRGEIPTAVEFIDFCCDWLKEMESDWSDFVIAPLS